MPSHVWSLAAEWCGFEVLLRLGQCSREWRHVSESRLLPEAIRRDCGSSVAELKANTYPFQTWGDFALSLFSLTLPTTTNSQAVVRRNRVSCRQVVDAATRALLAEGKDLSQVLHHDSCGNLTVLSPLRIPVQILQHENVYWEVHVGANANGNVLVGVMSDYGGIRRPSQVVDDPPLDARGCTPVSTPACRERASGNNQERLVLRSLCIEPSPCPARTSLQTGPDPRCWRSALNTRDMLGQPLTFAVCANTGEVYVEGRQVTTTPRGREPANLSKSSAGGVVVGVLMYQQGHCCRFAFTIQSKDKTEPVVEMVLPHLHTPLAWDETVAFGVEFCVQSQDQDDWVEVIGPRPPRTPSKTACQFVELNQSSFFS